MTEPATTAAALLDRLQRHYIKPSNPLPGGTLIAECGWNGTTNTSRCDALYVGFTGASSRLLVGHEIKTSRSDWLRELDQPAKADPWADQCHQWWVVAPSTEVVKPEELPTGWGLMVPSRRTTTRMDLVTRAAVHPERQPSWDACRSLIARLDTLHRGRLEQTTIEQRQAAWAEVDARVAQQLERATRQQDPEATRALDTLKALEQALGVQIAAYGEHALRLTDLTKGLGDWLLAHRDLTRATHTLTARHATATQLRQALDQLDAALTALRTATTNDDTRRTA